LRYPTDPYPLLAGKPASLCPWVLIPVWTAFPSADSYGSSVTIGLSPGGHPAVHSCNTSQREGGGPLMPCPRSWRGAGPSEGAQAVRLPGLRVPLAVRRWSQRPSTDRLALDCRQLSLRHVTRVSPSNGFCVFAPPSVFSAGSCPLTLSGAGKPLTQGYPLHPSHLRWGCCMNYCGAPDAGGSQLHAFYR
jgi:hypothetical protein